MENDLYPDDLDFIPPSEVLRFFLEFTEDCAMLHDLSGEILMANPATLKTLGYTDDEIVKKNIEEIYGPEFLGLVRKGLSRRPSGKEYGNIEHYCLTLDGEIVPATVSFLPVSFDGRNAILSLAKTARKTDESERFGELKKGLDDLFHDADCGVVVMQNDEVVYANSVAAEGLGLSVDESNGYEFSCLLPEDRLAVMQLFENTESGKSGPHDLRFCGMCDEGDFQHWLCMNGLSVTWRGRPAVLGIVRDITHVVNAETQRNLQRRMEAAGRVAGKLAHDFNNFLTGIFGYIAMAGLDMDDDDPLHEMLGEIGATADKVTETIKKLQLLGGKQEIARELLDFNAMIREVCDSLAEIEGDRYRVKYDLAQTMEPLSVDAVHMKQVLNDLLRNALEAMPDGGEIRIVTETVTDESGSSFDGVLAPGEYACLKIEDEGNGIREDVRKKLFDPFFTTKKKNGSQGLGLSLAFHVIEKHGGMIRVDSREGRGTVFSVYLPHGEPQREENENTDPKAQRVPSGSETVLLVEADPEFMEITGDLLERLGYRLKTACTGKEALEQIEDGNDPVQLAIVDMDLPDVAGKNLAEDLVASRKELQILFMIDGTAQSDLDETRSRIGTRLIAKPFMPLEFAGKIREILNT